MLISPEAKFPKSEGALWHCAIKVKVISLFNIFAVFTAQNGQTFLKMSETINVLYHGTLKNKYDQNWYLTKTGWIWVCHLILLGKLTCCGCYKTPTALAWALYTCHYIVLEKIKLMSNWASSNENVSSGVCDQLRFKLACAATETS